METNSPKQLPYQDNMEFPRNMLRILLFVLYNPILLYFIAQEDLENGKEFVLGMGDWPLKYHIVFFAPLAISVMNLQMLVIERKSGVPMPSVSRLFLFASFLVSVIFYSIFVAALLS